MPPARQARRLLGRAAGICAGVSRETLARPTRPSLAPVPQASRPVSASRPVPASRYADRAPPVRSHADPPAGNRVSRETLRPVRAGASAGRVTPGSPLRTPSRALPSARRTAEPAAFHVKHSLGSQPDPAGTTSGQPVNRCALGPRLPPVVRRTAESAPLPLTPDSPASSRSCEARRAILRWTPGNRETEPEVAFHVKHSAMQRYVDQPESGPAFRLKHSPAPPRSGGAGYRTPTLICVSRETFCPNSLS
jgi:hypothetical protein